MLDSFDQLDALWPVNEKKYYFNIDCFITARNGICGKVLFSRGRGAGVRYVASSHASSERHVRLASGRYASYWNAFLSFMFSFFLHTDRKFKIIVITIYISVTFAGSVVLGELLGGGGPVNKGMPLVGVWLLCFNGILPPSSWPPTKRRFYYYKHHKIKTLQFACTICTFNCL